jgi:signal transduction histidine kinase
LRKLLSLAPRFAFRRPPPWLGNLLVFGFLIVLTIMAFFLQTRAAEQRFVAAAAEHTRLLADAMRLYAQGAVLAGEATDRILTAFLGNSARFVVYLDDIEPFSAEELTAFADESGLAMIRILRNASEDNRQQAEQRPSQGQAPWVQGPPDRYQDIVLSCLPLEQLRRLSKGGAFFFSVPRLEGRTGCAMVVLESPAVEALRAAISVQQALESVQQLARVRAARLEGTPRPIHAQQDSAQTEPPQVRLIDAADGEILAEVRTPVAGAELVLLLDGIELQQRRSELWLAFAAFLLTLLVTGALGTWLLVKVQDAHERELRAYERRLSVQREEASLGRAASTIAHEMRNPLNAIGLGLQRLQLEAAELTAPHRDLIDRVMQAVQHTNGTISGLLAYARPGQQQREPVDLARLVNEAWPLYERLFTQQDAQIVLELPAEAWVIGDAEQLRRAIDNLLANAREALPLAGQLELALTRSDTHWCLSLTNDGLPPETQPLERLIEPWFTTKANGTGLGLAIVRRILNAHEGELRLDQPVPGRCRVRLLLPAGLALRR